MTERLTRELWIAHGFDVLRDKGHENLKADTMAKALGVSRGSFYWHFPSLGDFHSALLTTWREQNTQAVITQLQQLPNAHSQLAALIQQAIETPQPLENGMRRWGGANADVAAALAQVDEMRRTYLIDLLTGLGIPPDTARDRATLLTWAFIGRAFAPAFAAQTSKQTSTMLSKLLLATDQGA